MKTFAEYVKERNAARNEGATDDALQFMLGRPIMGALGGAYWGLKGLAKGAAKTVGSTLYGVQRGLRKPGEVFYNMPDEEIYWAKKKIASAFRGVESDDRKELANWVKSTYNK